INNSINITDGLGKVILFRSCFVISCDFSPNESTQKGLLALSNWVLINEEGMINNAIIAIIIGNILREVKTKAMVAKIVSVLIKILKRLLLIVDILTLLLIDYFHYNLNISIINTFLSNNDKIIGGRIESLDNTKRKYNNAIIR